MRIGRSGSQLLQTLLSEQSKSRIATRQSTVSLLAAVEAVGLWGARVIRVPSLQSGSVLRPPQARRKPARNAHSLPSFRLQGKCSRVAEGTRGAGRGESRMSAPEDRLISDGAAERFQHEAVASLTGDLDADPKVRELAIATLALTRVRSARQELAFWGSRQKTDDRARLYVGFVADR
jgi:hypothetical protein